MFYFSNPLYSQDKGLDPNKRITQYRLKSWTIDNGLPSDAISNIMQSKKGYMWIATYSGVVKFDGVNFTTYSSTNNKALKTEAIKVICEGQNGIIWIGTQKGIVLYKENKLYQNKTLNTLNNSNIESIFIDHLNQVWIGTNSSGLYQYNNDKLIQIKEFNKFSNHSIYAIFEDNDQNIWIGTIKGELFKYVNGNLTLCDNNNSSQGIYSFYQDKTGLIWAGTTNGLFNIVDNKLVKNSKLNLRFTENIIEDTHGYFWISSSSSGIFRYDITQGILESFTEENGLPNNRVTKITFDNQGNLWGTTYRKGIFQITDGSFTCYSKSEGLSSSVTTAILQNGENEYWFANENGEIDILKNGIIQKLETLIPIPSNQIKHILKDSKDNIWISTYGGLLKLEKDKEILLNIDNGFPDNLIRKTFEDTKGNIWVGTIRTGLHKIKPNGEILSFNNKNGLTANYIMTIIQYSHDIIIAGTKKGLNIIQNDSIVKTYTMSDGLPDNLIFNIYKDQDGVLWISTNSGFSRFENGQFTNYNIESGLQNNTIFDIIEDDQGYFWIPGPVGVMKISKQQLENYKEEKIDKIDYIFFDKSDGMKSSVCLGATKSLKDTNGNLWFLTSDGVAMINPETDITNSSFPPLYIEEVYTKDSIFNVNKPIVIPSKYKRFSIKYAALDLAFPEEIMYKYKLEPFEELWNNADNSRTISYTNIDPGTYTFKVYSSNNQGVWNKDYSFIKIKILPSIYQTLLFKIGVGLIILLLILIWNKTRINRIKKQQNLLENQVKERTQQINMQKEEIFTQSDELRAQRDYAEEQKQQIEEQNKELEKHRHHLEKLVSERTKDLEIAKKKAEESDRLKSSFLANMSHEIRTPMNAIIGFSNLLNDNLLKSDDRKDLINQITNNGFSLLNLIENILDLAKIETNQIKINISEISLYKIFEEVYFSYQEMASNKNLDFIINQKGTKDIIIKTDFIRINQILKLLVDNAIKFTEKGHIELGYKTANDKITIYIKDTGIGMSESQLKTIFARFTKIEDDKRKLYRGAGLGLAICNHLVTLLNGKIKVESVLNKGTTFYISLPGKPNNNTDPIKKKQMNLEINKDWSGKTILVTEDNESNYKFFEMILKPTKANILHAIDGKSAVELVNKNDIDLILMDIKMPNLSGLEATKLIREKHPNLPIIMQTAFSMENEEKSCREAGCNEYITKPIHKNQLLRLLEKFLSQ